ncbi:MAG: PleD family two-component system response regulator [Magnetococcales bacterium]|nr:PleD family two-component system response regulator [Magnetococcales bacterium]NGZ27322.1 PleD family two-component system response regulator [Magnetococcales bacterium]
MCAQEAFQKILVVDDEKVNLDVLAGLLKNDYRVVLAKDGQQALHRLEQAPLPDLILLDVMMPGMDGYQVCKHIKSNPLTRNIPVIFITALAEEKSQISGFDVGAVDYIIKPFSAPIVLARVRNQLEMKRRGDLLEELAIRDALTGIANRRRFDQFLAYEWERSQRYQRPFSLLLVDVDHFKLYNDHYGHGEGDHCLRQVAEAIARAMPRSIDLACRYGGEEFACLLPETSSPGATKVAERILNHVRALAIPHQASLVENHVTVSIGVATLLPKADMAMKKLVELADQNLYQAKHQGRNRVVCGKEESL